MAAVVDPSDTAISPPPPGVTPNLVNPQDHLLGVVPILIVFNSIATICLLLRIFTKIHILKALGWEDAALAVAWGCNITTMVFYFLGIPLHNQAHIWNISIKDYFQYIKPALAVDFLLAPASCLPKIAILLFYLRINPDQTFRTIVWILIGMIWAFIFAVTCAILFSCQPIHRLWNPTVAGHCFYELPLYIATPAISTAFDLVILALPIPMLMRLHTDRRTKIMVIAIFSAFSCTTVISAVRMGLLIPLLGVADITWDVAVIGDLTIVENNMMIICSSVLVLRPFLRRYFPSLFGRDRSNKNSDEMVGPDGKPIENGTPPNYDGPMGPLSKNEYRTKVRGGKRSKSSKNSSGRRVRGLWSISFGTTTDHHDEEESESIENELKQLPPTAASMGGFNANDKATYDNDGLSNQNEKSNHVGGTATPNGGAAATIEEAHPDLENGIVKTMSLDVQGRAY